jgi:CDP-diacylglycerol--glycerol-3-phosphate 3-phosphatidyltransferase
VAAVHPTVVTALGLLVMAAALAVPLPVAAALVLLSGLLDGVDGCVALLSSRVTELGARLDRLADRLGEVVLGALLWRAGVPAWLATVALLLMLGLELRRTRGPLRVTVAERPVRLLLTASALLTWAVPWAAALVALHVVGVSQLERERIVARS